MGLKYIHLCFGLFQDALKCLEPVYSVRRSNAINIVILNVDISQEAVQKQFPVDLQCSAQSPTAISLSLCS